MKLTILGWVSLLSQTPPSLDGTVDLIQIGFVGIALLWFALGKVHPDSTIRDLREQLAAEKKSREEESRDSKAVRDAIIRDVAPVLARVADREKEVVELAAKLLAWAVTQDGKDS